MVFEVGAPDSMASYFLFSDNLESEVFGKDVKFWGT